MKRLVPRCIALALLIFLIGSHPCAGAATEILNIRHWVAPDHTRVVIDISENALYRVDKKAQRVAILLRDTVASPRHLRQIPLGKPGLEAIAVRQDGETGVQVELALPAGVHTKVFSLHPFQDKPYRIVIDILLPDLARQEKEARERIKVTRKDRVIVIDPGHGGEDPGAVGKGGTLEKDVVLSISRKLKDILNKKTGYRSFLTRNGDYYVSFKKRMEIAREYGADLFVSIHADAALNRKASGSSVYVLSTGAASNEAAKILARNENIADIIGGVADGEGTESSDPILLNMFQTHAMNQSKEFGVRLLKNFRGVNRIKYAAVQEAPFLVLKMPEIPSVLIETAYISNPREEKLLRSDRFQSRIAIALARSISECVPPYPPTQSTRVAVMEKKASRGLFVSKEVPRDPHRQEGGAMKRADPNREHQASLRREVCPFPETPIQTGGEGPIEDVLQKYGAQASSTKSAQAQSEGAAQEPGTGRLLLAPMEVIPSL